MVQGGAGHRAKEEYGGALVEAQGPGARDPCLVHANTQVRPGGYGQVPHYTHHLPHSATMHLPGHSHPTHRYRLVRQHSNDAGKIIMKYLV